MDKLFKFDPHTHTSETSKCGHLLGADLVDRYHAAGYDGIVITDHLHDEYISSLYCKDDWDACIDQFLQGYRRAKRRGEELGLNVILGIEIRFTEPNDSDYLIYGIDEKFLRANPYMYRSTPQEFFRRFGDEVFIIAAHPFRGGNETVFTEALHGIEVFNSNPRHNNHNDKALALCESIADFYPLCGSDAHRDEDVAGAWMLFDEHITDSYEFVAAIKRRKYSLGHEEREPLSAIAKICSKLKRKP